MVRVLFLFLTRFHVNAARSNGNQQGAKIFPPKLNACVPCVRVLCKTVNLLISSTFEVGSIETGCLFERRKGGAYGISSP